MEHWLSKSRVLLGLSGVLLVAALNRQDPMVYGMFLFLAVVSTLGFVLPWLSLRSMSVKLQTSRDIEITEGEGCNLGILIERKARWPAFMVDIETVWEWSSQRTVLRQTVPIVRRGHTPAIGRVIQFPCRGHYELVALRLTCSFPLGLIQAQHIISRPSLYLRVLPRAQAMRWPLPWDVTDDPMGKLTTRRLGQSYELGTLRPYQLGEQVGRVNWRASARAGELIIQHFQQSGSIRLRVVVDLPRPPMLGQTDSAAEQAVRLASGVCDAALAQGAQLQLYLNQRALPVRDEITVRRLLAEAPPPQLDLAYTLVQAAADSKAGEQIAVIVAADCLAAPLLAALRGWPRGCSLVVCVAQGSSTLPSTQDQAHSLKRAIEQAGFSVWTEAS